MEEHFSISDYNYFASSVGNAYFSGISFDQLWDCVFQSSSREELDAAVSATIRLNEISKGEKNV